MNVNSSTDIASIRGVSGASDGEEVERRHCERPVGQDDASRFGVGSPASGPLQACAFRRPP